MSWRTVQVSSNSKLELKLNYLVVRDTEKIRRVYIPEIAVLIIESTAVSLTAAMLCELSRNKVKIIFCDEKRIPYGELVNHNGGYDSTDKLRQQIAWEDNVKKEVWTEIVRMKIKHQAELLDTWGFCDKGIELCRYSECLVAGDATNREGHAAKVYFNTLFGNGFSRRTEDYRNSALNYGYSILVSSIAREISICGYDPRLGIFHDNGTNPLNLAYDLVEPFRPVVDNMVKGMVLDDFGKLHKQALAGILSVTVRTESGCTVLLNAIRLFVLSVFEALESGIAEGIKDYEIEVHEGHSVL